MIKRALRIAGLAATAALILLVAYGGFVIARAWRRTPEVVTLARMGPIKLSDLSAERRQWLLKVEDPGFLRHRGMDFATPGQGNTNLTQSLVKRFYFERFEPGFQKIEQVLIARFLLDRALSKDEQLRAFLNHAYLGQDRGRPIIGFEAAAQAFFGKPFAALSDEEYLAIVATAIAPRDLDPRRNPTANAERVRRIRRLLAGECQPAGVRDVHYERC